MIRLFIRQLTISLFCFAFVLLAFAQVDWMKIFGFRQDIIEEKLEKIYWDLFSQSEIFVEDEELLAPLDSMLSLLCRANDIERQQIQLHLVKHPEVNAYACPGDHLVVYTSLIEACRNGEELCGVLAHELAHISAGHVMRKLMKELGLGTLSAMIGLNKGGESLEELMYVLSSTAYDRALEKEADELAVVYLERAGVNPHAFADFLLHLSKAENSPSLIEWISTHPDSEKRSRSIRRQAAVKWSKDSVCSEISRKQWECYKRQVRVTLK